MSEFLLDKMPTVFPEIVEQPTEDLVERAPGLGQIVLFGALDGSLTDGN